MISVRKGAQRLALVVSLGAMAFAAFAQETGAEKLDSACGTGAIEDAQYYMPIFEGIWTVEHLAGVVMAGGMVMPFPADNEVENIELKLVGSWLEAHHPEMQQPMMIGFANEMPWLFAEVDAERGLPEPGISREQIETEAGCDIAELPNLLGDTQVIVDGVGMQFLWHLWPIDANNIYVVQHTESVVQGMLVISRRSVRLMRM